MKSYFTQALAISAAVLATMVATPSFAGLPTSTLTIAASPSTINASGSTTLTATLAGTYPGCQGSVIMETATMPATSLCTGTVAMGETTATCTVSAAALGGVGTRSVRASFQTDTLGQCSNAATTTSATVTVEPSAVPTTSEWTLWGMVGALLIGGGIFASRRFRAGQA